VARILIIDDSPTVVRFVENALTADGHEVIELDSFVVLPRIIRQSCPDLVLLDLQMPALHGRSFGRFIRQFEEHCIPIVIFSSLSLEEMEEAAKELDAAAILEKGVSAEKLQGIVRRLAGRRRKG